MEFGPIGLGGGAYDLEQESERKGLDLGQGEPGAQAGRDPLRSERKGDFSTH